MLPDNEIPLNLRAKRAKRGDAKGNQVEVQRLSEPFIKEALPNVGLCELFEKIHRGE